MSETLKVIFSMCTVSLALAALIVSSIGNLRADVNLVRTELIDTRKEVRDNRIEIINIRAEVNNLRKDMGRFGKGQQVLTERVTSLARISHQFACCHCMDVYCQ